MKRINNIYQQIISMDNLRLADQIARKGKKHQSGVKEFDKDPEGNLQLLNNMLVNKTFKTSVYKRFIINEPKEREISCLPYFPDRILHHAIMLQTESIFLSNYTSDTYSCIKNKGVHAASYALRNVLKNKSATQYCLQLDIKKFYPSVDHEILKLQLRRKFKDRDLLQLLDEIIDSSPGLPIGNLLSQFLANFYLSPFDHWVKEQMQVWKYFRYADDMIIPASDKQYLHWLLHQIKKYLNDNLKLTVKGNYKVFPVAAQGINAFGYIHYHEYVQLRPSIKHSFARAVYKKKDRQQIAAYKGWISHCKGRHLLKKILE